MRLPNFFLISLLVFFLPACVLGQVGGVDFTTGKEISDDLLSSVRLHSVEGDGRQGAVLWDTTHGVYLNYQPFARYTYLVDILSDSGFTIDCCGTGVHTVNLLLYDIIIIVVGSSWTSSYTQEEVDSLISFYNQGNQRVVVTGDMNFCENTYLVNADDSVFTYNIFEWLAITGGIFIMGDNSGCQNINIRPVAQGFNFDVGLTTIYPSDLYFTNFAAHPIFNNVSQVYYRAAGEISASAPSQIIAWTDASEPVVGFLDETIGLELLGFSFSFAGEGILLRWETGCEINTIAWIIDRRTVSGEWAMLARIPSSGNSPTGNRYSFTDTTAEYDSIYYYRIGNFDGSGRITWLSSIRVDMRDLGITGNGIIAVTPNPFAAHTEIKIYLPGDERTLVIYNVQGRAVRNFSLPSSYSFLPTTVTWDGTDGSGKRLPSGIYFCRCYSGSKSFMPQKIMYLD